MIILPIFQAKLLEKIKQQIDIDQKYLFYPNEKVGENNLEKHFPPSFSYPLTKTGNSYYFNTPKDWLTSLIHELKRAKKFIFLQFFSISSGIMWEEILNILKVKQKENVEIRIIYDNLVSKKNCLLIFLKV